MVHQATPSAQPAPADRRLFPPRVFIRPPVVMELLFGLSPLAGIAWWGWDTFLVLMLHLLALALAALFLALRMLTLSSDEIGYFIAHKKSKTRTDAQRAVRYGFTGLILFVFGMPLVVLIAMIVEAHGGHWYKALHSLGDFWRVIVVSSGLWLPLAAALAWEAGSYIADAVLPRLPLQTRLRAPARHMGVEFKPLSPELRAFLHVRAWVVLRMIVTVLAVGIAMPFGDVLGVVAIVVLLVALKTLVAVLVEAGAIVDLERRQAAANPNPRPMPRQV